MRIRPTLCPLFSLIFTFAILALLASPAAAQNQAGVVVDFGDGKIQPVCVKFSSSTIDGVQLLQLAGFELDTEEGDYGTEICSINELGCNDPKPCFCQCSGDGEPCIDWNYWLLEEKNDKARWTFSQDGPSDVKVKNNDVNGWVWGPYKQDQPPLLTIDQICGDD
ncbi:MAG: hypothetical protein AAGD01_11005 [Acidobacteriota bacterium]